MPIHGIQTEEEKQALASELAFAYIQKLDTSKFSPENFAETYLETKQKIYCHLESRS